MDSSQPDPQINGKFFSKFELVFDILDENRKIFKPIAKSEYYSKFNVLYINGFASTSSTN